MLIASVAGLEILVHFFSMCVCVCECLFGWILDVGCEFFVDGNKTARRSGATDAKLCAQVIFNDEYVCSMCLLTFCSR